MPPKPELPIHIPDRVVTPFAQGLASIRTQSWDAAGAMFRKAIDIATKHLGTAPSLTLIKRIDDLAVNHTITPGLKDLAHKVRLGGNDAVHDDDPFTEKEARDLEFFARMFLTYSFTLPGMLKPKLDELGVNK